MIRISLPLLLQLYTVALVAVICGIWLISRWRGHRRESRALRYRLQCIICAFPFEDRTDNALPACPKCGCLNERGEKNQRI